MTQLGRNLSRWLACAALVAFFHSAVPGARAQQPSDEPTFESIQLGFNNKYKVGSWTPVELVVRGGREAVTVMVTITTPDGDGTSSVVQSERPYQLLPGQLTRVRMYVKPGRSDAEYQVRLHRVPLESDDVLASKRFSTRDTADALHPAYALSATAELIVSVGPSLGVEAAVSQRNLRQQFDFETWSANLPDIAQLPTRWYGYEGVDWVLLAGSQPEIYGALSETNPQLSALAHWVRMGGRLLVAVGNRAEDLIGQGAPLAEFVPGQYAGLTSMRPGRAFETYTSATEPLPELRSRGGAEGRLDVPQIVEPLGRVEAREGDDLPLVIRAPYGFGEIVFVAADLDQAPFQRWAQRGRLLGRLLEFPLSAADMSAQKHQQMGFNDLAGQLRAGLDQFTGVKVAPFSLVALMIVGYLVLIGPVDYLLVTKVFKRMELTWITFPLMVLLVTVGAYAMAYQMKGRAMLVNQVDIVDVDLTSGDGVPALVRGTTWANVFSPQMRSYQVGSRAELPGEVMPAESEYLVSWLGLPGTGYGGMNQRAADPPLFSRPYAFAPQLDEMFGVPIRVWSTKGFASRWSTAVRADEPWVSAQLQARFGDALEGSLTSELPITLNSCMLAYRGAAYRIGRLAPGESFEFDELSQRRLSMELNKRRVGTNDNAPIRPWDVGSLHVPSVVERMMFFKAGGAEDSVGLVNRFQGFIDLSSHLTLNQAILVGQAEQPASALLLNGATVDNENNQQTTFYRFLLPVKPRATALPEQSP